jgi:hypothetical protein
MSILTELSSSQRTEIVQQLRGEPRLLSAITVSELDLDSNPWHREIGRTPSGLKFNVTTGPAEIKRLELLVKAEAEAKATEK